MDYAPDSQEKRTVLAVDDDPESLQLIHAMLKGEFRVRLASNGEQALQAARELPRPDTILLDLMMPGLDGYEVCRRLKADPATKNIPVILLTAKVQVQDAQLGFDAGCADYITKPIIPPLILARVRTHVALKLARDFLARQSAI
jgi:putative two-component system response regulator